MMIRCIAVDDEPRALEVIAHHAGRVPFLSLEKTFLDPFEAIEYAKQHPIELVFLDINMPDIDGMRAAGLFESKPLIVFTTAHSEYALKGYEADALDYLLKPFDFARFMAAATKARTRLGNVVQESAGFLFLNTGNQRQRVVLDALLTVEGEGNYVRYCTDDQSFLVRSSIKEALKSLPAHRFVQIHRSYIVALNHIDKIEDNHVFVGKKRLPIGATYRTAFYQLIDGFNG